MCLVVAHIAFVYTRFGRYTRAVGSNEEATRRAGIAVDWHVIKVYTLAGLLAGVAAVVDLAIYTNTTAVSHRTDNLSAISAVVIGGTSLFGGVGSILMSAVGAFVPTVLQNGLVIKGVQPFWQEVVVGADHHLRRLPRPAPAPPDRLELRGGANRRDPRACRC